VNNSPTNKPCLCVVCGVGICINLQCRYHHLQFYTLKMYKNIQVGASARWGAASQLGDCYCSGACLVMPNACWKSKGSENRPKTPLAQGAMLDRREAAMPFFGCEFLFAYSSRCVILCKSRRISPSCPREKERECHFISGWFQLGLHLLNRLSVAASMCLPCS
jgi:hypothetical protein